MSGISLQVVQHRRVLNSSRQVPALPKTNYQLVPPVRVSEYDYELPPERIARYPAQRRDRSRLLVLDRETGCLSHRTFSDIVELLRPGDLLALNDTRVIPARLFGTAPTGGRVELLLLEPVEGRRWRAIGRPGRRLRTGCEVEFGDGLLHVTVMEVEDEGVRVIELDYEGHFLELLDSIGEPPLPPYIDRDAEELDRERYQTVYAREPGAVAAPTAGLHFTEELLADVRACGAQIGYVTLHVGLGTFRPVHADLVEDHEMHSEYYRVSEDFAGRANDRTGRLIAVGTTVSRTLESVVDDSGQIHAGSGHTNLFIYPGYDFRAVEAMVTNFHLPRSTLLMMVSAFVGQRGLSGRECLMAAYREALKQGYRFYSYGDAMLIH